MLAADRTKRIEGARDLEAWKQKESARNRVENLEKVRAMSPDAPLTHWYELLDEESGVRPEALEALRHIERRQNDMEEMLSYGILRAMILLPDLDIKATPHLCQAADAFLLKHAQSWSAGPEDAAEYEPGDVERCLPGMQWLVSHGCDCSAGLHAVEQAVRSHRDSPARKSVLAIVAEFNKKN